MPAQPLREAAKPDYFCPADASAAADKLRALASVYHWLEAEVEARPKYGPGRPSANKPRTAVALQYGLKVTLHERPEAIARKSQEAGCFVLLSNVPSEGDIAHDATAVLTAYKNQHGMEQNYGFLKDPLIVNSLFLDKPERIEALGMVLLLALLLWRLMERSLRRYVAVSGMKLAGWDHKVTERPTSFMMMTKFSNVIVLKVGQKRQTVQPLSQEQRQYLTALDVPATCFTLPSG
jgi:transposase